MLTEIYIGALLVDEDLADQVRVLWDAGKITDEVAAALADVYAKTAVPGHFCVVAGVFRVFVVRHPDRLTFQGCWQTKLLL